MTLAYGWRLACLSAAVFFLINLAMGAAVMLAAPATIRLAGKCSPRRAASLLMWFRMLPALSAALLVLAACVPSYLWLEPGGGTELVSRWCLAAAALSVGVFTSAAVRAVQAAIRSHRFVRNGPQSCLALAGIFRPRLIVSRDVLDALTREQLEAALAHERAHWVSHDNLKRLFLLLAPGLVPFYSGFRGIERAWSRFTEWDADDRAAAGSASRSLCLASALVQVARLQTRPGGLSLTTSLLGESPDLATRVARLLRPARQPQPAKRRLWPAATAIAIAVAFATLLLQPATLTAAHGLLEYLMD
jgi:Peptidase family M48